MRTMKDDEKQKNAPVATDVQDLIGAAIIEARRDSNMTSKQFMEAAMPCYWREDIPEGTPKSLINAARIARQTMTPMHFGSEVSFAVTQTHIDDHMAKGVEDGGGSIIGTDIKTPESW